MRSPKLTSAAMVAAALLALATAAAAAASSHSRFDRRHGQRACKVTLSVAPRLLTSGETALAYGQDTCNEEGQQVTLYQRSIGTGGFSVAGTTTTASGGVYQLATPALKANSVFYATIGASQSARRTVRVAAQVTLEGPPETKQLFAGIHTGRRNAVTFTGTAGPEDDGALVVLQRENAIRGNEWHRIGHTFVNNEGKFALTHVFVAAGESDIRVMVRSNHRFVASPSNVLSYQISQAQNPSLTIESSTDPIPVGGSTVISGTVASAPNTTVTLYGHPAHGANSVLATAMTNSEGKYSFPAQAPATSTFYHVTGAGRSSAVLYEGVKYVLTATPSATSVQSGQALSFTGTVDPAVVGHAIYLERQNAAGTGFHVVATSTVQAGGAYSISRVFFAPGTDVLRVKIPGDPENAGTASQPYSVTVTPAPAATKLGPEPQNNSTLPPEGQV